MQNAPPPQGPPFNFEHMDSEMLLKTLAGVAAAYIINSMLTSALLQFMPLLLLLGFVGVRLRIVKLHLSRVDVS